MRPIEILLVVANLLTFFVLVIPPLRAVRWMGYAALIALLIAGMQVLVEGYRWQMIAAYALSGLLFLVWLRQTIVPAGTALGGGLDNRLGAGLAIGLGVLALALSIVLPIVLPVFRFPPPTGPYAIGTLTYHWIDTSRHEDFGAEPNAPRELMVQLWYPAKNEPSAPRAPYLQHPEELATSARLSHLPDFIFNHFKYVATNAIPSAPVADAEPSYPVLIFMSGRGGYRQSNTFQIEELVSHRYIVAAIDQPYASSGVVFPDGRLVADPNGLLTGRLDLQHEGIFGVSLGGIVTGEACRLDSRLRACLDMDAAMPADVVQSGLHQPAMFISRDAQWMQREGWTQADVDETQTTMRAVYDRLQGEGYLVLVPGMFHVNHSDAPYFSPIAPQIGLTGPIDGQRGLDIVKAYSLAFFDHELKGQPAELLDGLVEHYPEVVFATSRP